MRLRTPRLGSRTTRIIATIGLVAGVLAFHAPSAGAVVGGQRVHRRGARLRPDRPAAAPSAGATTAPACWATARSTTPGRPSACSGLSNGVADVQAVWDHTCALTDSGGVKCWGHNGDGELGDGTKIQRLEPVATSTVCTHGVAGDLARFRLRLRPHRPVVACKCWGYNGNGQLGDGTRSTRKNPVDVFGLTSGVAAISAGWDHTCALLNTGGVKCWGEQRARRGRRRLAYGRPEARQRCRGCPAVSPPSRRATTTPARC